VPAALVDVLLPDESLLPDEPLLCRRAAQVRQMGGPDIGSRCTPRRPQ
jgi:hypothetical protein